MFNLYKNRVAFFINGILFLGICMTVAACGSVQVPIKVTHPAEVDLTKYKRLSFNGINGRLGQEFAAILKDKMSSSGQFELMDNSQLDDVIREQRRSQSDQTDESHRIEMGKLLSASAIIKGTVNGDYAEQMTQQMTVCPRQAYNGQMTLVPCRAIYRTGTATVSGSVDVTDVETGRIVSSKHIKSARNGQTSAIEAEPPPLNGPSIVRAALDEAAERFAKAVMPWSENVMVAFEKDSDLPDLDIGIRQSQVGDLSDAIETFRRAAKASETNPNVKPQTVAKAYWNLGLAQMYGNEPDQALVTFKKLDAIAPGKFDTIWARSAVKHIAKEAVKLVKDTSH